MPPNRYLFSVVLLAFSCVRIFASQIGFSHLSMKEGLSHQHVNTICQDATGFLWFGTEDGLNRYDGYRFTVYRHDASNSVSLDHNTIRTLFLDTQQQLWVGTESGLNLYDPFRDHFLHFDFPLPAEKNQTITALAQDSSRTVWIGTRQGLYSCLPDSGFLAPFRFSEFLAENHIDITALHLGPAGRLWIGTRNRGLFVLNPETRQLKPVILQANEKWVITAMTQESDSILWFGTATRGVIRYNLKTQRIRRIYHESGSKSGLPDNHILALHLDKERLWIATQNAGLSVYHFQSETFHHFQPEPHNARSLSDTYINCLYEDAAGTLWIGTWHGGINYFNHYNHQFTHYHSESPHPFRLGNNIVSSILEDAAGNLWIGTERGGLSLINPSEGVSVRYQYDKNMINTLKNIQTLLQDHQQNIWIGTYGGGLFFINQKKNQLIQYSQEQLPGFSNYIQALSDDGRLLWVGTSQGVYGYTHRMEQVFHFDEESGPFQLADPNVTALFSHPEGSLWIGTQNGGLYVFSRSDSVLTWFEHQQNDPRSLADNRIYTIYLDNAQRLWIGTGGGLCQFHPEFQTFSVSGMYEGLISNMIFGILDDDHGNLWLSSNKGLTKYNPETGAVKNYTEADGLQSNQFLKGACLKSKSGLMYFGGINGLNVFHPDSIQENPFRPPVVFTNFLIANQHVPLRSADHPNSPLTAHISQTEKLVLSYKHRVFEFEFAALDYVSPSKNTYAYQLEGFDENWHHVGTKHTAAYTNLNPGNYLFRVRGANNDGLWNKTGKTMAIRILSPWWQTTWAYVLYTLVIVGILVSIYLNIHIRHRLQIERLEARQEHQLDLLRLRFFTNISHEFRTPLTLILSPLEKMKKTGRTNQKQLNLVHRNARKLLYLINQLLDFRKMESGSLHYEPSRGDIVEFVREIINAFKSVAEQRRILLHFSSPVNTLMTLFDPDKLDKILYNLLSNAFKFTPDGGEITVQLSVISDQFSENENCLQISVNDTGPGIPQDALEHIFERYFQVKTGTGVQGSGIGLTLSRELAQLHGGDITAGNQRNSGAEFTLTLPLHLPQSDISSGHSSCEPRMREIQENHLQSDGYDDLHSLAKARESVVLIVEDDPDMRHYICHELGASFRVIEAADGKTGLNIALEEIPDLIVSDLMMPEMSGYQLCHSLKENTHTSHIPVILLTAKSSEENQIKGLKIGADDYITKPFSISLLKTRIDNLIHSRNLLKQRYSRELMKVDRLSVPPHENSFIGSVIAIVNKNMSDPDFSVTSLARAVNMSRVQLYRKLNALLEQKPVDLIRILRLKKAYVLLSQGHVNVTEAAYETGFNSSAYFSQCFQKQFGMPPSQVLKNKM